MVPHKARHSSPARIVVGVLEVNQAESGDLLRTPGTNENITCQKEVHSTKMRCTCTAYKRPVSRTRASARTEGCRARHAVAFSAPTKVPKQNELACQLRGDIIDENMKNVNMNENKPNMDENHSSTRVNGAMRASPVKS